MSHRSAKTGRKVTRDFASKNADTTIKESKSKDTKRLDWLQKQRAFVAHDSEWRIEWGPNVDDVSIGKSLRTAIDKAIAAEKVK